VNIQDLSGDPKNLGGLLNLAGSATRQFLEHLLQSQSLAVNVTIERIQNKGAATFARYLEKHGPQGAQDASETGPTYDCPTCGQFAPPEKEEP